MDCNSRKYQETPEQAKDSSHGESLNRTKDIRRTRVYINTRTVRDKGQVHTVRAIMGVRH